MSASGWGRQIRTRNPSSGLLDLVAIDAGKDTVSAHGQQILGQFPSEPLAFGTGRPAFHPQDFGSVDLAYQAA